MARFICATIAAVALLSATDVAATGKSPPLFRGLRNTRKPEENGRCMVKESMTSATEPCPYNATVQKVEGQCTTTDTCSYNENSDCDDLWECPINPANADGDGYAMACYPTEQFRTTMGCGDAIVLDKPYDVLSCDTNEFPVMDSEWATYYCCSETSVRNTCRNYNKLTNGWCESPGENHVLNWVPNDEALCIDDENCELLKCRNDEEMHDFVRWLIWLVTVIMVVTTICCTVGCIALCIIGAAFFGLCACIMSNRGSSGGRGQVHNIDT